LHERLFIETLMYCSLYILLGSCSCLHSSAHKRTDASHNLRLKSAILPYCSAPIYRQRFGFSLAPGSVNPNGANTQSCQRGQSETNATPPYTIGDPHSTGTAEPQFALRGIKYWEANTMQRTSNYWRRRAVQARAQAEEMISARDRQVMLRMSQTFERLAATDQKAEQPRKKAQSQASNSEPE
jgi:hypothetical protein